MTKVEKITPRSALLRAHSFERQLLDYVCLLRSENRELIARMSIPPDLLLVYMVYMDNWRFKELNDDPDSREFPVKTFNGVRTPT